MSLTKSATVAIVNEFGVQPHLRVAEMKRGIIAQLSAITDKTAEQTKELKQVNLDLKNALIRSSFCKSIADSDDMTSAIASVSGSKQSLIDALSVANDTYACKKMAPLLKAFSQNVSLGVDSEYSINEFVRECARNSYADFTIKRVRNNMFSIGGALPTYDTRQPQMIRKMLELLGAIQLKHDNGNKDDNVYAWNDDNKLTKLFKTRMGKNASVWTGHYARYEQARKVAHPYNK